MSGVSPISFDIDDLIVRFFCRETLPEENRFLLEWIRHSEKNRIYFIELRNVHLASLTLCGDRTWTTQSQWKLFLCQRTASGRYSEVEQKKKNKKYSFRPLRYVSAVAALFLFGILLYKFHDAFPESAQFDKKDSDRIEFAVSFGSRASTSLPDGSLIWVNAGSRISYASDYNKKDREIQLEGEAYFDVTTDPQKPFVVKAKDISIVATGTAFNVSAYKEDLSVTTTLVRGVITINGKNIPEPIQVAPNQTVEYFSGEDARIKMAHALEESTLTPVARNISVITSAPAVKVENNPEIYTSWKEDRWVIEGERLESLMHKIERRYNVTVYFTNEKIKNYRFNGSFEGETIDEVMKIIHKALPVSYKIDKGVVLLFSDRNLQYTFDEAASLGSQP